ncbi:MAG: hypothetical protein K2K53_04305 [Oscillospiraceae bacterium]|nr:hypothetical protein [Oscillospiraceae bacterium]
MGTGFHFEENRDLLTVNGQDIPVILTLMAAAIALEVFLALKKDGRLGLVLPGLWLLKTVVQLVVWMLLVSSYAPISYRAGELCLAFCVENIPTLFLLAVCGLCRLGKRWKTKQQLEKTRIADL